MKMTLIDLDVVDMQCYLLVLYPQAGAGREQWAQLSPKKGTI